LICLKPHFAGVAIMMEARGKWWYLWWSAAAGTLTKTTTPKGSEREEGAAVFTARSHGGNGR
jgi:hypothetical protein